MAEAGDLKLTFGQLEALLARLNSIADDKRTAFRSRLKNLQSAGVVERVGPGRGKAGEYDLGQLMWFAVAVDLIQIGMTPSLAARVVVTNGDQVLRGAARECLDAMMDPARKESRAKGSASGGSFPKDYLLLCRLAAMSELSVRPEQTSLRGALSVYRTDEMDNGVIFQSGDTLGRWRISIINISQMTRAMVVLLSKEFEYFDQREIISDILVRAINVNLGMQIDLNPKVWFRSELPDTDFNKPIDYQPIGPLIEGSEDAAVPYELWSPLERAAAVGRIIKRPSNKVARYVAALSSGHAVTRDDLSEFVDAGLVVLRHGAVVFTSLGDAIRAQVFPQDQAAASTDLRNSRDRSSEA